MCQDLAPQCGEPTPEQNQSIPSSVSETRNPCPVADQTLGIQSQSSISARPKQPLLCCEHPGCWQLQPRSCPRSPLCSPHFLFLSKHMAVSNQSPAHSVGAFLKVLNQRSANLGKQSENADWDLSINCSPRYVAWMPPSALVAHLYHITGCREKGTLQVPFSEVPGQNLLPIS